MVRNRKAARLQGYDYSQNGAYFLTLCSKDKAYLFGRIVGAGVPDGPSVILSPLGTIVRDRLDEMGRVYSDLHIAHYVIMPNHVHLLLVLDLPQGPSGTPAPTGGGQLNARIPQFISTLKRMTNKTAGRDLWQRSYHDHIIRSDEDFAEHWTYIDGNAARWTEDEYYTPDPNPQNI